MTAMRTIAALIAGTTLAATAVAQEQGSRQTREFVQAAGQSDTFEIMEARTALTQSSDPQVRAFADRMIRDHGETSRALQDAARNAGLAPPPMALAGDQATLLGALQSLRGRDFDRAYWRHQALAHRSALTVEQQYAASGDNASLRQVAAAAVPIIQSHLTMAEQMADKAGAS